MEVSADGNTINVIRGANNGLSVDISIQGEVSKYAFSSLTLSTKKDPAVLPDALVYFSRNTLYRNLPTLIPAASIRWKSYGDGCKFA